MPPTETGPSAALRQPDTGRLAALWARPEVVGLVYLVALAAIETLTNLWAPQLGLVLHGLLMLALLFHASRCWGQPLQRMLLTLALAPLTRVTSFSLPLARFPQVYWYLITSIPLLTAAAIAARTVGYGPRVLGLTLRGLPVQLLVGLTGVGFGYLEYRILAPKPLAAALTLEALWLPVLILLISTGFYEELAFRGLMQRSASEVLGRWGILYVAVVFAVLHIGYKSVLDFLFVFGVALFFGWMVIRTRSIAGVTLSHGLTNIVLFLVVPFLVQPASPARVAPIGAPVPTAAVAPAATRMTVVLPSSPSLAGARGTPTTPAKIASPDTPTATATPITPIASATPVLETAAPVALLTPAPTATPAPATTTSPIVPPRAYILADVLRARTGPGVDYPTLGLVRAGEAYVIVGKAPAGAWWRICCVMDSPAWVAAEWVRLEGDASTVPVVSTP